MTKRNWHVFVFSVAFASRVFWPRCLLFTCFVLGLFLFTFLFLKGHVNYFFLFLFSCSSLSHVLCWYLHVFVCFCVFLFTC